MSICTREPPQTAAEWNSGSCDVMAAALHRIYGLPMMAEFEWGFVDGKETLGYLIHAWVRLPDGRALDAAGPREMFTPTPGADPLDPWVQGFRIVDLGGGTDHLGGAPDAGAEAWIAEHLAPVLEALDIHPVGAVPST